MNLNQTLKNVSILSAFIGWVDSSYLAWVKWTNSTVACLPNLGNCNAVNSSRFSQIYGIPIAFLGGVAYLLILVFLLLDKEGHRSNQTFLLAIFGLSLVGVLFSAYLTYIEIAVLKAICPYCVLSAITILLIFICTLVRIKTFG
ncbi:vitamin K epoxide reductase family [Anaerolinea thermolimosa]|uniref:vitamin K epoxide reductase family protein n=1 Tax=Anaerolinea thermolimosa TaxID=229919 RepID=UPI000780EF5E|nr:vitamin K epoxide reductase family protein [Anaerolinea thermolimosa]GAP06737.1 vitamin K epoxide reductase family [Anaerolinea thermolimosa]